MSNNAHDRFPAELPRVANLAFHRLTYCKVRNPACVHTARDGSSTDFFI